jgi:hypothetical protein
LEQIRQSPGQTSHAQASIENSMNRRRKSKDDCWSNNTYKDDFACYRIETLIDKTLQLVEERHLTVIISGMIGSDRPDFSINVEISRLYFGAGPHQ